MLQLQDMMTRGTDLMGKPQGKKTALQAWMQPRGTTPCTHGHLHVLQRQAWLCPCPA